MTEPKDLGLSGSLIFCPRVVAIKEKYNFTQILVRIRNMSARVIKIQPRSHLCEHEVTVLRPLSLSNRTESDNTEKKRDEDENLLNVLGEEVNTTDLDKEQRETLSNLLEKWTSLLSKAQLIFENWT